MKQKQSVLKFLKEKWMLPLFVLLISGSVLYGIAHAIQQRDMDQIRTKAELNAVTYADRMIEDLNGGINITNALEQILISEDGEVGKFDTVAESMMADYVQSIQLAPGGVVTEIYPEKGNEAGKIDLIHDEKRGPIVNYGIEHDMVIMQGPFELKQGGQGIAIRNPVFLQTETGEKKFWGLTIAIIRVPEIFSHSVDALNGFGYQYVLSKTRSPLTTEFMVIDSSGVELVDPVARNFELGGCTWKIEVMPTDCWKQKTDMWVIILCGGATILLLEGLVFALLILEEQGKRFKKLSVTDGLTGLLNRTGFDEQMDHYLEGSRKEKCVGILLDVDNFKLINDVYGHAIGDQVLYQLARAMEQTFYKNAVIGRNGGDEFCILLKHCSAEQAAAQIEAFTMEHRTFQYKGKEESYSISVGYAEYPTHAGRGADLLRYADMALYEVKLRGKHSVFMYTSDVHTSNRTQLGFALNDVSLNLPGAFFIYKAQRDDERILFANKEMIRLTGCDNLDDFLQFTHQKFSNLVHPDELDAVEESIWEQITSSEDATNDYVQYRLATKDGGYKPVLDFGRLVESNHYGAVFYVLLVDCDFIKTQYGMNKEEMSC